MFKVEVKEIEEKYIGHHANKPFRCKNATLPHVKLLQNTVNIIYAGLNAQKKHFQCMLSCMNIIYNSNDCLNDRFTYFYSTSPIKGYNVRWFKWLFFKFIIFRFLFLYLT